MATSSLIPGQNLGWRTPRVCFVSVSGPCSCMDIWSSLSLWYAISAICMLFVFVAFTVDKHVFRFSAYFYPTKHIWPWSADLSPTWPLEQPDKSKWSCCTLHISSYFCCLFVCCWWLWLSSTSSSSSSSSSESWSWWRWSSSGCGERIPVLELRRSSGWARTFTGFMVILPCRLIVEETETG